MSRSPECAAIEKCSDVAVKLLSSGVVSLDTFGQELVSADFITNEALQSILDTLGVSATTKARKLLSIVHTQVKVNNEKFFKRFVNILENTPPLATLHDRILTAMELQASESPTKFSAPEPKSMEESTLVKKVYADGFLCRCGNCSIVKFLKGNCSEHGQYPFLKDKDLSQNELAVLKRQLQKESRAMSTQFKKLIAETFKWLKLALVTPENVKSIVLGDLELDDLNHANSFEEIIEILWKNRKWSWFHYSVLKQVIDVYCQPDDLPKQQLESYEEDFKSYCSRRVFECPLPIEEYSPSRQDSVLVVKFEIDVHSSDMLKLQELELEIGDILNAQKKLLLLTVRDGCTELFFCLPKNMISKVFPLSSRQEELLARKGVQQCYLYADIEGKVVAQNQDEEQRENKHLKAVIYYGVLFAAAIFLLVCCIIVIIVASTVKF